MPLRPDENKINLKTRTGFYSLAICTDYCQPIHPAAYLFSYKWQQPIFVSFSLLTTGKLPATDHSTMDRVQ